MTAGTLDRLVALALPVRWVRGNHEREVVDAYDEQADPAAGESPEARVAAWAAKRIERRHRDLLAACEATVVIDRTLFCHGSPRDDDENITTVTPDDRLQAIMVGVEEELVVCGHTHRQFDRRIDRWRVVNAGSVGMPYEGRPGAFWVLLDPEVELRCTSYDIDAAAAALRATGYPDIDESLRHSFFEPTDPDWVARYFEGLEAG
jgi:diadenosine tetraphosphatase ApaH/serine/threonine PP2A family protein phosphatase